MLHKLYVIFRDFQRQVARQNISAFAASTAFFLFLSIVPMLIMICTIIPFTPLTEENLVQAVTDLIPGTLDGLMRTIISDVYDKSAGVLSIAAIATVWSAGKGVLALTRGLNEINDVEEERNYFVLRFIASLYTLVMLVIVILSLLIMVFGNVLVELLLSSIPQIKVVFALMMHFRFLFVWFVLALLFAAVYAYVPNKKLKLKNQVPGAVFSAVVWSVFSWGFSIYVERSNSFSTYGSLSIIVIVMLWLYFCMYIVLIGAYINRYFGPAYRVFYAKKRSRRVEARNR